MPSVCVYPFKQETMFYTYIKQQVFYFCVIIRYVITLWTSTVFIKMLMVESGLTDSTNLLCKILTDNCETQLQCSSIYHHPCIASTESQNRNSVCHFKGNPLGKAPSLLAIVHYHLYVKRYDQFHYSTMPFYFHQLHRLVHLMFSCKNAIQQLLC